MTHRPNALRAFERIEVEAELRLAETRRFPAVKAAAKASQIVDQPPIFGLGAAAFVLGVLIGDRRMAEAGARVATAVVATTILKKDVERLVTRTRPNAVLDGEPYRWQLGGADHGAGKSFPSGHTADAVTAARALARIYPDQAGFFWAAAALAALVQLPSGAHYPTDLVAGTLVGLAGEAIADAVVTEALHHLPG